MAQIIATETINLPKNVKSTFELWQLDGNTKKGVYCVEWSLIQDKVEEVEQIRILINNNKIVDYDGIDVFPKEVKTFLHNNKLIVPYYIV